MNKKNVFMDLCQIIFIMIIFSLFYYIYCYFYYHDNPVVENHAFFDTYYFNNPDHPLFESLGYTPFIKKENKVFIIKEATDREKWSVYVYANTKNGNTIKEFKNDDDQLLALSEKKLTKNNEILKGSLVGFTEDNLPILAYRIPKRLSSSNTKNIENYDFLFTIGEHPYQMGYEGKKIQPKILGATKKNENIELYVVPIKQLYSGEYNKKKIGENFFIYHIKNYHSISLNKISKKGSKTREDFLSVNATIL